MLLRASWIVLLLVLVSCSKPPATRVPIEYQGTDLVTVENHLDVDLCDFRMTKKGDSPSKNWLGRNLPPGGRIEMRVKPGLYTLSVRCDQVFHGMDNVIVSGTTNLGLGKRPAIRLGEASLIVPVTMDRGGAAPAGGGGGGDEQSCTGLCGGPQGQFGNCCPEEGWHCVIDPKELREQGDTATGVCTLK